MPAEPAVPPTAPLQPASALTRARRGHIGLLAAALAAAVLAACRSVTDPGAAAPPPTSPASNTPEVLPAEEIAPPAPVDLTSSNATSARAYRVDGARHLYALNRERIYVGRLPPLLYAVGVLNIHIDSAGRVSRLEWLRAPRHAPEVMAEIARTVERAAPFPVPTRLGKVVYTDTWLWHRSGKFQLDTLTEGQD